MALLAFFGLGTTLAVGAAALSVPVIIHLLNRRRYRIVTWAAMRFLLLAQKQNTRRIRLEQILLLMCRTALILCVLLAMASVTSWANEIWTFFWPDTAVAQKMRVARIHHVIVLDGSLSMNLILPGDEAVTCFDRARELAIKKILDAPAGDGFSILVMKEHPVWVGDMSQDGRRVARELEDADGPVHATHGGASVPTALSMVAAKLIDHEKRFPAQRVYFFTDMQKTTWASDFSADSSKEGNNVLTEVGKRAKVVFVDVGRNDVPNRAVIDLRIEDPFVTTDKPVDIKFAVHNFGHERKDKLPVKLLVGRAREPGSDASFDMQPVGGKSGTKVLDLSAGESKNDVFTHKFSKPGTYAIQVRIEGDALPADDARSLVVTVKENVPVLLVNGKASPARFEQGTEYLHFALDPFRAGKPLKVKVVSPKEFIDEHPADADLLRYDVIFFCDVGQIGDGELRRLRTFLRMGGGVVLSVGDETYDFAVRVDGNDKNRQNRDLYKKLMYDNGHGLLPGWFTEKKGYAPEIGPENQSKDLFFLKGTDFDKAPLEAFQGDKDRNTLYASRFRNYLAIEVPGSSTARTILSFWREPQPLKKGDPVKLDPTGHPALLEFSPLLPRQELVQATKDARKGPAISQRYRGKVILFTTSLNMDWTSWPASPSYLAMMQETVRLATAGKLRSQSQLVGSVLEEVFVKGGLDVDVEMLPPAPTVADPHARGKKQKKRSQSYGDVGVVRWPDTDLSGIYVMNVPSEGREYLYAVNCPAATAEQRASESDLSRVDRVRLKELAPPPWDPDVVLDPRAAKLPTPTVAVEDAELVEQQTSYLGPVVAHGLLLAVIFLLFLEVVLAWAFGRHTTVDGALSPPAVGKLWPIVIAAGGLLLFTVLAGVRLHAARTGDFMGFLPDGVRQRCERYLGVPPAQPGEGTHWDLESRRDLFFIGYDFWPAIGIILAAICLIVCTYTSEGPRVRPAYKFLLAGLRLFLLLFILAVLLPQLQLRFDRQGWPDLVLLIDDSRSMGEPDNFSDNEVKAKADVLARFVKKKIEEKLPARIAALQDELARKRRKLDAGKDDVLLEAEVNLLDGRLKTWQNQLEQVKSPTWAPSRLQLVQALLAQPEMDWLDYIVNTKRRKLHIYHLDKQGRAVKIVSAQGTPLGEITDADADKLAEAHAAVANLEAEGDESRLGTAVRQVIEQYRASLSGVIMFTDGVTTRDEVIAELDKDSKVVGGAALYAASKNVPLYFVGIGDDHEIRDLQLHDLVVDDVVRVNDILNFQFKVTGTGVKEMTVPVVLKERINGKEVELARQLIKVEEHGKSRSRSTKVTLRHRPREKGTKHFIIELETPKREAADKLAPGGNRRLERRIDVLESSLIKVLLVDGTARYDFRFLKSLLEREIPDENLNRSMEVKVLLLDAHDDFHKLDKSALADFPATSEELGKYDVVIFGDCDPHHKLLGDRNLKNLAAFVQGDNTGKPGGGILFVAGSSFNPHAYKKTPLAGILPVRSLDLASWKQYETPSGLKYRKPDEPELRSEHFSLEWTPTGRQHPIFRFGGDERENVTLWSNMKLYWWSTGYTLQPLAEVLAVHPLQKAAGPKKGEDGRHPLIVQQFVGSGRAMFFGFDESWRWRFREQEERYNAFWIQTIRYLSRLRVSRTDLRLQQQTPFRRGETAKVTVRFPDTMLPGKEDANQPQVKVNVEYTPNAKTAAEPEFKQMTLSRSAGGPVFEGIFPLALEGKYRFRLTSPDVKKSQPGGEQPSADAVVEMPPGELEKLRLNRDELTRAGDATQGGFYTLADADKLLLEDMREGFRPSLSSPKPPVVLWNHGLCFALVLGLLSAEWILRKRKHLL